MDILQCFFEDRYANEIAYDAIDFIFCAFENRLVEIEQEKLEIPKATELAMLKLEALIQLATIQYDGKVHPEEVFEKFDPDGEPYPNTIDSWARGMVSTRKVVAEENSFRRSVPASHSNTPSVSSFRSSATGRSRTTTGTRGHRAASKQSDRNDKTGQIMELEGDLDAEFGELGATGYMFNLLEKAKNKKAKGYHVANEGVKGEFELMEEQLAKAARETRGKKFVLDRYGQTVLIGKIEPTSLPPFNSALQTVVKDEDPHPRTSHGHGHGHGHSSDPNTATSSAAGGSNNADKSKKRQFVRVAGSRGVDGTSFQPNLSLASTLSGVETIPKVAPGVVVRSKTSVRAGDPIPEDSRHISKKTYLSKTQSVQPSIASLEDMDVFSPTQGGVSTASKSTKSRSMLDSRNKFDAPVKNIESLPDIDPLEGSRRVVFDSKTLDISDDELGLGPVNTRGQAPSIKLPQKPNDKQKANMELLMGSPEHGKPRDRDMPKNMKPVVERKHLPAPPLGHITGHGLGIDKNGQNSLISHSIDSASMASEWFQRRKN